MKIGCSAPNFARLKTAPCLSKTAQTWREKPANSSDMVLFSGKLLRHDNKTRLLRYVGAGLSFKSRFTQVALTAALRFPQSALTASRVMRRGKPYERHRRAGVPDQFRA